MLVSSYTTVKFQGIDPWVQVSQLEGHKPSSIHCSSCLVKHIKPSQKSDFSNNNNHFILAQKLEEWPRSVSIYAVTVRLWLESPQRIPCSCLMPGLERLKPLGGERARALRSISSPPFSLFLSSHLLLFFFGTGKGRNKTYIEIRIGNKNGFACQWYSPRMYFSYLGMNCSHSVFVYVARIWLYK